MSPKHLYGEDVFEGRGGDRHQLRSLLGAFAKQLQTVVTSLVMSVLPYDRYFLHMDICDLHQANVREIIYIYIYIYIYMMHEKPFYSKDSR